MPNELFSEVNEDNEFDIQIHVLKKRDTKKEPRVYVEYDKLTYNILAISPSEIQSQKLRNGIVEIKYSNLTKRIFENKIPLSKILLKKNHSNGQLELIYNKPKHKSEFDFIFATFDEKSYIHLQCDVIAKNIHINFDFNIFKSFMASEKILEKDLKELPDYIEIYCIDKNERSKIFGKFTISTKELFQNHIISYKCPWLPDDNKQLQNIGFVYYNDNQVISAGYDRGGYLINKDILNCKPNLLYKQDRNVLKLQSTISDVDSFRLDKELILYFYKKYDPAMMLGSLKLNSEQFNEYNYFEVDLSTEEKITLVSNYFHLHIEEENASTYF